VNYKKEEDLKAMIMNASVARIINTRKTNQWGERSKTKEKVENVLGTVVHSAVSQHLQHTQSRWQT